MNFDRSILCRCYRTTTTITSFCSIFTDITPH